MTSVVERVLREREGNVLCFLPGAREIDQAARDVGPLARRHGVDVLPLHGTLAAEAQDEVLTPGGARRIVLATNIAETSVTVPGVRTVVDSGWQKVARYDAARGIDRCRPSASRPMPPTSAPDGPRAWGRASRSGSGQRATSCVRSASRTSRESIWRPCCWPSSRGAATSTRSSGSRPPPRTDGARRCSCSCGSAPCDDSGLTAVGRALARLPVPPRLARLVVDAGGHPDACLLASLLSDGRAPTPDGRTTVSDLLALIPVARALPHLRRGADAIGHAIAAERVESGVPRAQVDGTGAIDEDVLCRAVLSGFPDRVAQRRAEHGDALLLATGTGARLSPASGVRNPAWLVALDVRGLEGRETLVHLASGIEREWLAPTHVDRRVFVDGSGRLRATLSRRYEALTLSEQPDALRPEDREVLVRAWLDAPRSARDEGVLARLAFAELDLELQPTLLAAATDATRLADIDLEAALPWAVRQRLLTDAPERLPLPSGRTTALVYGPHRSVRAAVKLQELFGLADTPRVGKSHTPVVFDLLAPNGRSVQTTQDLRSFWTTTYLDVRKELRGRYPRHPWPEDPWTATPTHRARPRAERR